MAKKTFRCQLVTPTARVTDDEALYVNLPLWDGLMGFIPGRGPILARLGMGEMTMEFQDKDQGGVVTRSFFVEGGTAKMENDVLTVLADTAIPAEELTVNSAEAEWRAANAMPAGTGTTALAQADAKTAAMDRARAKMVIARKSDGI